MSSYRVPDDILREIFTYLRPPLHARHKPSPKDIGALYNASLVCKQFSCHALEALWRVLYDLAPLFNLVARKVDGEFHLFDNLSKAKLTIFGRYASKVLAYRELDLNPASVLNVSSGLQLSHYMNRPHLLPNLRVLELQRALNGNDSCCLLGPNLRAVTLDVSSSAGAPSLLSHLCRIAPHLELLQVKSEIHDGGFTVLNQFPSLKSLTLEDEIVLYPDFDYEFPFVNNLVSLAAPGVCFILPQDERVLMKPLFHKLEELEIMVPLWPDSTIVMFAPLQCFPNLKKLRFEVETEYSEVFDDNCTFLFSELFNKERLLQHLEIGMSNRDDIDAKIDPRSLFRNAVPQPILQTLIIRASLLASLPPPSIQLLARIFPNITNLSLMLPLDGLMSLEELALLAQLMPQLVSLEIGGDGRRPKDSSSIPLLNHQLRKLSFSNASVQDFAVFARFIYRIFPVADVHVPPYLPVPVFMKVQQAKEMLEAMRECRRDDLERSLQ